MFLDKHGEESDVEIQDVDVFTLTNLSHFTLISFVYHRVGVEGEDGIGNVFAEGALESFAFQANGSLHIPLPAVCFQAGQIIGKALVVAEVVALNYYRSSLSWFRQVRQVH